MKRIYILLLFVSLMIFIVEGLGYLVHRIDLSYSPQKEAITFWTIQLKPIYENEIKAAIKDFEHENKGYKVIWVDIPIQEAQKRTLASILSSNPPDVVNLNPEFSLLLAQRNALYNFSQEDASIYQPNLVEKLKYDGAIYALPFYATSPVTIYNKEIYNNCIGTDFIKTYNDLYDISFKLSSCSKAAPFVANLNENDTLSRILNKYGIYDLDNPEQKQKTKEVYSMFNDMYKKGYLPKDTLTINHREMIERYMSNGANVMVAGSNFINMIKQNAPDIYSKSALSEQLTGSNGKYDVSIMNFIIPKKSKNIDASLKLIKLLTNEENQIKLAKLTNVLPANSKALDNDYFKTCPDDLVEQARCISARQLNNLNNVEFDRDNKKAQNEAINKTLEKILLNNQNVDLQIDILQEELAILKD